MILYGRIYKIIKKKKVAFIIIYNYKFQQIVIKGKLLNSYLNCLNYGDIVYCKVDNDLENNGKYKCKYDSFLLKEIKILSKNEYNFKLPINIENFKQYSETKYNIRKYLHRLGYIEVNLPILTNGKTSSKAESFQTIYSKSGEKLFLRKTMDIFLRMYSCSDINKIFSIGNCFRNEYLTSKNKPEFEMLSIFTNYLEKKDAINLAIKILKIITSKQIVIEYIDDDIYKTIKPSDDIFYIISKFQNLNNSYCLVDDKNETDEFKIKFKGVTIIHGVSEIFNYNDYKKKITEQGISENYGELKTLEKLLNSGAPICYNLGISIVRILSLYNNKKIKDYDILSFDRLKFGGKYE